MSTPGARRPTAAPVRPTRAPEAAAWRRIEVGTPGPEFEPRPPGQDCFDFPDTECDGWATPSLTVRFASVRGAKHRYYRQPRQDAARAAVHEETGTVVFAVADGVSSATSSERGAIEACRAAVERMLHMLPQEHDQAQGQHQEQEQEQEQHQDRLDFGDVAHHAALRLRELTRWRLSGREPEAHEVSSLHATTLVAGVVRPDPGGPVVELFRIGDSGAWVLDLADGRYQPLFRSKTDPDTLLVSNDVTPLPHVPDPLEQTTARLGPSQIALIGTDGFADPLGDGDGQVGALFARHLAAPPAPPWFAHLLDFSRETFDDDRTLLAVWPYAPDGRP